MVLTTLTIHGNWLAKKKLSSLELPMCFAKFINRQRSRYPMINFALRVGNTKRMYILVKTWQSGSCYMAIVKHWLVNTYVSLHTSHEKVFMCAITEKYRTSIVREKR